jgi:hypothetical protein
LAEFTVSLALEAGISQGSLDILGVIPLVELLDERFKRRSVVPFTSLHGDGNR